MRTFVNSRWMSFVAGAAVAATAIVLGGATRQLPIEKLTSTIDQEPVLFWDIAGFGLGGPIHERLAVYSDGLVNYAYGGDGVEDGAACFTYVPTEAVVQLTAALHAAGVFQASDEPIIVSDVPLTTTTVFESFGNGGSRARTFSFSAPLTPASQRLTVLVQQFKGTYLPDGLCNGSGW